MSPIINIGLLSALRPWLGLGSCSAVPLTTIGTAVSLAVKLLKAKLSEFGLSVKSDWQVFPIKSRAVKFLSYKMDYTKTVLRKKLMYRMARRFKKARHNTNAHTARTIMSYRGILKHCDSYTFRCKYMYANVSIKLYRRLISNADKKRLLC